MLGTTGMRLGAKWPFHHMHFPNWTFRNWPKIGVHFKKPPERTQSWIKLGGKVTSANARDLLRYANYRTPLNDRRAE